MSKIAYKGITQNSSIEKKLSDEEFKQIAIDYYRKPDFSVVKKQLKSIANGGTRMNMIYEYYLKEVMSKAIGAGASWSIYDGLQSKEVMEYFAGKCERSPKFYPPENSLAENFAIAFRLCGIRYCVKLPNYPMSSVDSILKKYNINNNYYDFSCGWASRMLSAMHNGINYFGVDPNYELVDCLKKIHSDYNRTNNTNSFIDIRCQGSEEFIPEFENKIGLAFSSPPYYCLEDYVIGNQSYKQGVSYEQWLQNYMHPTISNIHKYLIDDGYFIINVKNFDKYKLEEDVLRIAKENNFYLHEIETLKNLKRCHGDVKSARGEKSVTFNDNSEKIFVFKKEKSI